jgi:hypothetical protein
VYTISCSFVVVVVVVVVVVQVGVDPEKETIDWSSPAGTHHCCLSHLFKATFMVMRARQANVALPLATACYHCSSCRLPIAAASV